jgi:hypothetical protein
MATPLSRLHEIAAQCKWDPPVCFTLARTGPPHAPTYHVEVSLAGHSADAEGPSLRSAQQSAANTILNEILNRVVAADAAPQPAGASPAPAKAVAPPPPAAAAPHTRGIGLATANDDGDAPLEAAAAAAAAAAAGERGPKSVLVETAARQGWALTMRVAEAGPAAAAGPFAAEALLDGRLVARGAAAARRTGSRS